MIQIFRIQIVRHVSLLFTGLVFLNSIFFLAEVSFLQKYANTKLMENVVKLLSGSAAEEKTGSFAEKEADCKPPAGTADILLHSHAVKALLICAFSIQKFSKHYMSNKLLSANVEIFSPPPEV